MSRPFGIVAAVVIFGGLLCRGSPVQENRFLTLDPTSGKYLVIILWHNADGSPLKCSISTEPKLIDEELKTTSEDAIFRPTAEDLEKMKEECRSSRKRRDAEDEEEEEIFAPPSQEATEGWNIIFPGTKWCGAGDVAKHDDDLGFHEDTDRCCRAHDKCDDLMLAGETKNNLTNKSPFTALSCTCDHDFYDCLSRINSLTSNTVGNSYFNLLRRPCYAKDYPVSKKCKKYRTFLQLTCLEYYLDTTKPQVYQWFKAKFYKQLPFPGPLTPTLPFL